MQHSAMGSWSGFYIHADCGSGAGRSRAWPPSSCAPAQLPLGCALGCVVRPTPYPETPGPSSAAWHPCTSCRQVEGLPFHWSLLAHLLIPPKVNDPHTCHEGPRLCPSSYTGPTACMRAPVPG